AKCMRIETGSFKTKTDKNGTPYYLHRLAEGPRSDSTLPSRLAVPEPQRADADTLSQVYSALLVRLKLTDAHCDNLRQRGLPDEVIDRNGYKTLSVQGRASIARELHERFGAVLLRVPGFVFKERDGKRYLTIRGPAGLIIPCRDPAGRIVALKVRRDGEN